MTIAVPIRVVNLNKKLQYTKKKTIDKQYGVSMPCVQDNKKHNFCRNWKKLEMKVVGARVATVNELITCNALSVV